MYSNFINTNGEHFFNQTYENSKWDLAAEATKEAIEAAIAQGVSMYYFTETMHIKILLSFTCIQKRHYVHKNSAYLIWRDKRCNIV